MEFGNWTKSECTEECGSLGVWKETRTCKEKDNTTDYCVTIAITQRRDKFVVTSPLHRKESRVVQILASRIKVELIAKSKKNGIKRLIGPIC